jgi:hypothetical protein
MPDVKTYSDVPPEKLQQLVTDLSYDGVPREIIRVSPQSNGKLRLDFEKPAVPAPITSGSLSARVP